jgi:transglutaminase-like putative cysteine protease
MPGYRIHHLTRYIYDESISVCHNLAHLLPRDSARHLWHFAELDITPTPAVRTERYDYFGNRVVFFAIQEPHRQLEVVARSEVDLEAQTSQPLFTSDHPWEQTRDRFLAARNLSGAGAQLPDALRRDVLDAYQFTYASPYIQWTPEIAAYAAVSFPPGRPIQEGLLDLTARIHKDFRYDASATTISTTLPEIFQARSGVCQDFAHFQIGCLRALGLATRYVSGYLLTAPPPGKSRLIGADASHAWLSVFLPDTHIPQSPQDQYHSGFWLDLDPTNNCIPSDKHITVAWGRDFGDVSPLRGVLLGAGRHQIQVSVDVSPSTEPFNPPRL